MPKTKDEITVREIPQSTVETSVRCDNGLTANGIVHVLNAKGKRHTFYLAKDGSMPKKYKQMLVENAEENLKSVPAGTRRSLQSTIGVYKRELGIK